MYLFILFGLLVLKKYINEFVYLLETHRDVYRYLDMKSPVWGK